MPTTARDKYPTKSGAVSARDTYLRRTYDITEAEYAEILELQGGHCACCPTKGKTRALHVDHNHKTKLVRGIVCPACNSGFRKFKDNPDYLEAAAEYLRNPPAQQVVGERVAPVVVKRRRRRKR